ncbi:hypothetical protein MJ560_28165 [Klebsiella pneumoniae]|nr:hypothetical protein MJ560_28165 [Klebsiella pneumoniae]
MLRNHLKQSMGFDTNMEGGFLARRRHLQALEEAANHLQQGKAQLRCGAWAGELLAEELRLAQQALKRDHQGVSLSTICWAASSPASASASNRQSVNVH